MTVSSELAALEIATRHYASGRLDLAEGVARRLLKKPEVAEQAMLLLAKALIESGRSAQAMYELERALRQRPDDADLLMMMHNAHLGLQQPDKALVIAERVFNSSPSEASAASVASLHNYEGRFDDAELWYRKALEFNPESIKALMGLVAIYSGSFRSTEAIALLKEALKGDVRSLGMFRYLAFHLQYMSGVSPQELFESQHVAGTLAVREADGYPPRLTNTPDPDRRLTIGYISPDFRQHACAHFIEPLLAGRDRESFRVIAFSATIHQDGVTKRLKQLVDGWRDVAAMQDPILAQAIAADKVDIAFDLAGHTNGTRLSALVLRPAPITATYLGYPSTTGAPGVDYRFVDSITDPPGADAFASEKLVRVDPCFVCFRPLPESPPVTPLPSLAAGHIAFGSFNALNKVSEQTVDVWCAVLKAVPGSRLILKGRAFGQAPVVARVRAAFSGRGIDPGRLELVGWAGGLREHLALYNRIDIGVDSFPYNGTTTTCEALWMGVPVIALRGQVHAARVGASLMSAVGLSDLVADTPEAYVAIAAALAADTSRLAALRSGMRDRMSASPLRDEKGFAGRFEGAIRSLWRQWCATQKP